jgi:hypothetical protein
MNPISSAVALASVLLALSSCSQDDVKWETGREALGGMAADQEQVGERWSLYRDQVVRSLDLMKSSVQGLGSEGTIVDRKEIDGLLSRISELREGFASETEQPRADAASRRDQLRSSFEGLRGDVDALLTRLGHSADAIARWQDKP